jgi:hypothetical protein
MSSIKSGRRRNVDRIAATIAVLLALSLPISGAAQDRVVPRSTPTIVLTSPSANAYIAEDLTPSVLLSASVASADYPIAHVVFYMCETRAGACYSSSDMVADIAAPPYEYRWTPPRSPSQVTINRTYQTWATAVNAAGQAQTSSIVPFTVVQPPPPPSINLVVPKLESGYVTPAAPVLYATAVAGDTLPASTIVRVDFLDGATVIGSVTAPNSVPAGYAFVWQNAPPGIHLVSARAIDSLGYSTSSGQVSVYIVDPDPPPQVALTSPATGQIFVPPNSVPLAATAMSTLGTIQRVEFVTRDRLIGTSFSPPYALSWSNPPPGTFAIVAKAYDDIGIAAASPAAYIQVLPGARAPAVVLTAPAPGASLPSGTPVDMAATAMAPDGSVGRVDFFAGNTLLGSSATSPYAFTWNNPASGSQSLVAKAVDLLGNVGTSAAVAIQVVNNSPPVVTLTSPANGSQFSAPASIALAATATDVDGSVAKVEFFAGAAKIAAATSAPFTATWSNVAAGSYALTAVATDNLGATATSGTVNVQVSAPPPTVGLTAPQSGATYAPGQSIVLTASASAPQSSISRVEFYCDGALINSTQVAGGPAAISVELTWTGATPGAHVLTAKVVTVDGATALSGEVGINVTDLKVTISEPYPGQAFQAPGIIPIVAQPTESVGSITQVEFFGDGILLGNAVTPPFAYTWSAVGIGAHSIFARARDTSGNTVSSSPINVTVLAASTLQIDAGIDGSNVDDDNMSISGTVLAPANSAVMVNGRRVTLDLTGHFFVDGVQLSPGANSLDVTLLSQEGAPTSRQILVTRTDAKPFQVTIDRQEGIAPFDATMTITNRSNLPVDRIEIDTNSDGTPESTIASLIDGKRDVVFRFSNSGTYLVGVKIFDQNNVVIYSTTRRVMAWNPNTFAQRTLGVYTGMLERLRQGDVEAALTAVIGTSSDHFREIFTVLGSDLRAIVEQLGTIRNVSFNEQIMQIFVVRPVSGVNQTFTVNLMLGEDGIWRIADM